jgi:hypothetical protein
MSESAANKSEVTDGTNVTQESPASGTEPRIGLEAALVVLGETAELFRTSEGRAFASFPVRGHLETWAVKSKEFRHWLGQRHRTRGGQYPTSQTLNAAIEQLEARAFGCGKVREVHVRVAGTESRTYLDLADENWRVVEIDRTGWRVLTTSPVKFRRPVGMLPLPVPEKGGRIESLFDLLGIDSEDYRTLLTAVLVQSLRPTGPYPVTVAQGEQGSGKSMLSECARELTDPNRGTHRAEPREPDDLALAASNGWWVCFDNLSKILPWLSDALCRLSSGGGLSRRKKYSDDEESLFFASRPILLNGIEELAVRSDLADRAIVISLDRMPRNRRKPESEIRRRFKALRPKILGALLDVLAQGIANQETVRLSDPPRLADFARFIVACEPALGWKPGQFLDAYNRNRELVSDAQVQNSALADGIHDLLKRQRRWKGNAKALLGVIRGEPSVRDRWHEIPGSTRALGDEMRRLAPSLRARGLGVEFISHGRTWSLWLPEGGDGCVTSVTSVTTRGDTGEDEGMR